MHTNIEAFPEQNRNLTYLTPRIRMPYEVDPGTQLLDSINPNVEMDHSMGQYGGGAE